MSIENGCMKHQYYQTKPASGAFFQYSFERKFRRKKFYSTKKRIELRSKRVNSGANFRPFTQPSTPAQV